MTNFSGHSSNPLDSSNESEPQGLNTAMIKQYLISLQRFGVDTIPASWQASIDQLLEYASTTSAAPAAISTDNARNAANSTLPAGPSSPASPVAEALIGKTPADKPDTNNNAIPRPSTPLPSPTIAAAHSANPFSAEASSLTILAQEVANCQFCTQLAHCRNKTVFGVGNPTPRLVFIGDGPGAEEDRQGIPFVGEAGQLLDRILAASNLKREEVYLMNAVKCRPPNNRPPNAQELANCWSYTERQLELLQPEFICCLGTIATRQLLKTSTPLGKLRQKFHLYRDSRVLVTYHPEYLLRTESAKKHVWEDMKMLMKEMGIERSI